MKGQNKGAGIDGREGATGWKNNISLYASGLHRIRRAVVNLGAAELRVRVEKKKTFPRAFLSVLIDSMRSWGVGVDKGGGATEFVGFNRTRLYVVGEEEVCSISSV